MARDADLCGRSKQLARLPWIAIPLAQMDAIRPKPFGQAHAVIHDKRHIEVGADTLQRFGCASDSMLVHAFKTELEGGDRAAINSRSQPAFIRFVNCPWLIQHNPDRPPTPPRRTTTPEHHF